MRVSNYDLDKSNFGLDFRHYSLSILLIINALIVTKRKRTGNSEEGGNHVPFDLINLEWLERTTLVG